MERVRIEPGALFLLALGLLVLPIQWVLSWALAAAVHELCHYAAVLLCGGRVTRLRLGAGGAAMEVSALPPERELVCALAGPLGGLYLLTVGRWMPTVALCALFQSLWNLLPLYPLDGGRALRCLLSLWLPPDRAAALSRRSTWILWAVLMLLALYALIRLGLGWLPLGIGCLLLAKIACKPAGAIVQ